MIEVAKGTTSETYVLKTGCAGASRLQMQDEIYGASTRRMMLDAGIRPGMRVLDLACGTGIISHWIAAQIGPDGSVVGVDINQDQLRYARDQWKPGLGSNPPEFVEADAYNTGFPSESFDMVHCRLLLCHLERPLDALREMHRLLKPGGTLVCQDVCISTVFCHPCSHAYTQSIALSQALGNRRGVNYDFGQQLHTAVLQAGFGSLQVSFTQPVYMSGRPKGWWLETFAEAVSTTGSTEFITEEELTTMLEEMARVVDDESILIAQACMPAVSAVK